MITITAEQMDAVKRLWQNTLRSWTSSAIYDTLERVKNVMSVDDDAQRLIDWKGVIKSHIDHNVEFAEHWSVTWALLQQTRFLIAKNGAYVVNDDRFIKVLHAVIQTGASAIEGGAEDSVLLDNLMAQITSHVVGGVKTGLA